MEEKSSLSNFFQRCKPYIAMISLQFGYAGMIIITKVSLNRGMSHYVVVVYRHAFATAAIAPFALVLERKLRPKITFPIFVQIFALGLLGPVTDQNFYYTGLKFTSPTFSCAISNMLPTITFVLACRMEKVDIKKFRCQAKVIGIVVTLGGAMLMTLYKGNVINLVWSEHRQPQYTSNNGYSDKEWLKGSIFLIIATLAWASFFILQAITMRRYTAQLSLTALVCGIGTLQSMAVTYVLDPKSSVWNIGWDMNLFAAAYAGIVSSSIAYYVQGIVMQKKGPVFVTSFTPLSMIIVAIMSSFILPEKFYVGSVVGGILIVMGLYSILWGKYKEHKHNEALPEAIKKKGENGQMIHDIEMQINQTNSNLSNPIEIS